MSDITASCGCGQLRVSVREAAPTRVSVCHCLACKKRTGSAVSVQARWPDDSVTVEGRSSIHVRIAESGNPADFHFCPECGATVFFRTVNLPGMTAIPLGALDDPFSFAPTITVFEDRRNPWVEIVGTEIERYD